MTDAKLVRFAAVLVVLAGYVTVVRGGEARIAERAAENARAAERIAAGARTLAARDALERERSRLRAGLRLRDLEGDRAVAVARFLRDAAALAAARRCTIVAVAAAAPTVLATSASATPPADGFEPVALELTLEGRYADLLATIRALAAAPVLAAVDVASLARKNANAPEATVTASLRVALQRLTAHRTEDGGAGARRI